MRRLVLTTGCLAMVLLAAACANDGSSGLLASLAPKPAEPATAAFPPNRAMWDTAPLAARAAHARALHAAFEQSKLVPVAWADGGASGTITVSSRGPVEDTYCQIFTDRIETANGTAEVLDLACWGDGWELIRDPVPLPVLGPAFAQSDRVYVVRRGGALSDVAKRTGASVAELERLNPAYPARLTAGTKVLLP